MIWLILAVVIAIVIIWGVSVYNRLISAHEMIDNAMAQIAAQVESRWDALTQLIKATKDYQAYEAETLTSIVRERQNVTKNSSVREVEQDDAVFENALRSLNVVVEQYPELRASNVYQQTMTSLDAYENNVRQARMIFNDTVTRFNRLIKIFPNSIVANMTGFSEEEYFVGSLEKSEMPQW